jgi:tetratricopeptide (TPR) repeat protein
MVKRVYVFAILGDLDAAVSLAKRSRDLGEALGHTRMLALATYYLGQANFNLGNFSDAEAALSDNVTFLAQASMAGPTGTLGTLPVLVHVTRAMVRAFAGDFQGGAQDVEVAMDHARASMRPYDLSFAAFGEGFVRIQQRKVDSSIDAFHRSLSLGQSREMSDPRLLPPLLRAAAIEELRQFEASRTALPHCKIGLGHALLLKGDVEGGMEWLLQAHEIVRRANRYMMQIWVATCLAQGHFMMGQMEDARGHADEAVEVAQKFDFNGFRVAALRARGLCRIGATTFISNALDDLQSALALASRLKMRAEVANCHAALGFARAGDAARHLDVARDIYNEIGMTPWFEQLLGVSMSSEIVWC